MHTTEQLEHTDADGAPVSCFAPGDELPAGLPAWQRLGVGTAARPGWRGRPRCGRRW